MDTSGGSLCSLCPEFALDPLGHHAVSCKRGRGAVTCHNQLRDAVTCHNQLRDAFAEACCHAHLPVRIKMGSGLTPDHSHSHSANVLGAAALPAETRKHMANDKKCQELGWACVPIAMETYGNWGQEAKDTFSHLASHLTTVSSQPESKVISDLYGCLNLTMMRAIARAILAKAFQSIELFT